MEFRPLLLREPLYSLRRLLSVRIQRAKYGKSTELLRDLSLSSALLVAGCQKSGNTFFRFVYFNLLNQIERFTQGKLTYDTLNGIQSHTFEGITSLEHDYSHFPLYIRTHDLYNPIFKYLRLIYLYRNPLDAMVSSYYYNNVYRVQKEKLELTAFLRLHFPDWCYHMKTYIGRPLAAISYEAMMRDAFATFNRLFSELGLEYTAEQLETALELSSFENVSRMEEETGTPGMTEKYRDGELHFDGKFTRSGKIGQWRDLFSAEDVDYCLKMAEACGLSAAYDFVLE